MSRRAMYPSEKRIQAAERYIKGETSAASIAAEMGMTGNGDQQIVEWQRSIAIPIILGFESIKRSMLHERHKSRG